MVLLVIDMLPAGFVLGTPSTKRLKNDSLVFGDIKTVLLKEYV